MLASRYASFSGSFARREHAREFRRGLRLGQRNGFPCEFQQCSMQRASTSEPPSSGSGERSELSAQMRFGRFELYHHHALDTKHQDLYHALVRARGFANHCLRADSIKIILLRRFYLGIALSDQNDLLFLPSSVPLVPL